MHINPKRHWSKLIKFKNKSYGSGNFKKIGVTAGKIRQNLLVSGKNQKIFSLDNDNYRTNGVLAPSWSIFCHPKLLAVIQL